MELESQHDFETCFWQDALAKSRLCVISCSDRNRYDHSRCGDFLFLGGENPSFFIIFLLFLLSVVYKMSKVWYNKVIDCIFIINIEVNLYG